MQLSVLIYNMTSNALRRNLFDTIGHWINDPIPSYCLWARSQSFKDSTAIVYQAMFSRFCNWLRSEGKTIDRCESSDIQRFLDQPNTNLPLSRQKAQTSRQRQQYIRLLERIFDHLSEIGLPMINPAKQASLQGMGRGRDRPTRFLDHDERHRVIHYLETSLTNLPPYPSDLDEWIAYRDLALFATLLGAGLKIGNLKHLTLNCINLVEQHIELSQANYTHRARLQSFALPPIRAWLSILSRLPGPPSFASQTVFLADRAKGFGRQASNRQMHPSSVHRRIQAILADCDISGERASAQTLRNTYAAILIDTGASDNELVDFLGLQANITAQRLRGSYSAFNAMERGSK